MPDRPRRALLYNLQAGQTTRRALGRARARLGLAERDLLQIGPRRSVRDAVTTARRRGCQQIISAGGDGTLHRVIAELGGTDIALGILPLGTSNDLAKHLQIPADLDAACDALNDAHLASIDLLNIGGNQVATTAGLGLPALVARACNRARQRPMLGRWLRAMGTGIYTAAAGGYICGRAWQSTLYRLRFGHGTVIHEATGILVGQVASFGGGLRLPTTLAQGGGRFWVIVITASSRRKLLATLCNLRLGRPPGAGAAIYTDVDRLTVTADGVTGTFGDGEWLGLRHSLTISVAPAALRVLVPRHGSGITSTTDRIREAG